VKMVKKDKKNKRTTKTKKRITGMSEWKKKQRDGVKKFV